MQEKEERLLPGAEDVGEADQEGGGAQALRAQMSSWTKEHEVAVEQLEGELSSDDASGAERSLARVVAHDLVILDDLGRAEVALVKQIATFAELARPTHVSTLVKVALDLAKARTEGTQRATEMIKTLEALSARRRIAATEEARGKSHLRRVV